MHLLLAAWVIPSHTNTEVVGIFLRWVHLLAGVTWVGLLYFFNFINVPFMRQVDAAARPKVLQTLTLPALQWFRWSALLTVFMGFWYWSQVYVAANAHLEGKSPLGTIGFFPGDLDHCLAHPVRGGAPHTESMVARWGGACRGGWRLMAVLTLYPGGRKR